MIDTSTERTIRYLVDQAEQGHITPEEAIEGIKEALDENDE